MFSLFPRARKPAALAFAMVASAALAAPAHAISVHGPILPYESFNDSPFKGLSYSYFHLDTFESGSLTAPGVTASVGSVVGPGSLVDSVDGGGPNGHSFFSDNGPAGITFTFDAAVLGTLPTDAGIAWTDGELNIHFSAVDGQDNSLGQINDGSGHGFSQGDGNPSNYRFFWARSPNGIKSITISNDGGGIEVDHLQFGAAGVTTAPLPEPASLVLLPLSIGALAMRMRKRSL